jgi:membrane associated rhomboid family serine protease
MLLIPLRHENMRGRRWPVITFALIAINILAFLATHWTIEAQDEQIPQRIEVRAHLMILAAVHPELNPGADATEFVKTVKRDYPEDWKEAKNPDREPFDAWEANLRTVDEPRELQAEMDNLSQRFTSLEHTLLDHYGFVPAHPSAISYLTANFLHGGWLHLIGNMWFLWLAGFILEDNWGRPIYTIFYLLAGAVALQIHGWFYPHSIGPTLGASGAVAALMGAFLVRFPKLKIEMFWAAFYIRGRFKAAAYWLLPLWGLMEVFYGTIFGKFSGVAHWAHVGGFAFGMIAAVIIRKTGWEQQASEAIEQKVSWTADPLMVQANELVEQGKIDEAIAKLRECVKTKPDAVDAYAMLQQLYWRKGDTAGHQDVTSRLCQLHLKRQDKEAAWRDYEEFQNTGGQNLPAATWLELCRYLEEQQNLDRAVSEYEKLAAAWPKEKPSVLALIAAGRLSLKRLNRPADALRFYQAAAASPVPHLDWDANIQTGITAANAALGNTVAPVSNA